MFSIASVLENTVDARPPKMTSSSRRRSMFVSNTKTSASIPIAMKAAFIPTTPPPMTITFAAGTPGTPPRRTPRPPSGRSSMNAPAWVAILPATSLIGASSGSCPSVLDGLVRDRDGAGLAQPPRQLGRRREMQVREEQLPLAQQAHLGVLRLLDLQDHVRLGEDRFGVRGDPRALGLVLGIGDHAAVARARLDDHLVAMLGQLAGADRCERDPVLVRLDLRRYADLHSGKPMRSLACARCNAGFPAGRTSSASWSRSPQPASPSG